jgi:branched-chain amino acid transport system substrate-binding protein
VKRALLVIVLLAGAVYWFGVRTMYYKPESAARSDSGSIPWLQRGFTIAIVWPPHADPSLIEGVKMAADDINAAGGPIAGKFKLMFVNETDDGGTLARRLVKIDDLVCVIGHELEGAAIQASIVYEDHGVLFISPKATDPRLTQHLFQFVFRLTPDDTEMAAAIGDFMLGRNWKRNAVVHGRGDHGEMASAAFLARTSRQDNALALASIHSFFYNPTSTWYLQDFRPMVARLRAKQFDSIFLAATLPHAAKLLVDMASMGVTQPIVATDKLDSVQLWHDAGQSANGLYVASAVNPESTQPAFVAFRDRFRQRNNGTSPGYGASQGYEAMMLFANAANLSQGADPLVLATTMRTRIWQGLFGGFNFTPSGDIRGRDITIKQMRDGQFHPVYNDQNDPNTDPEQQ